MSLSNLYANRYWLSANRGFTLIELMVAVSIIAILSGVGLVNFNTAKDKARDSQRKQDLKAIRTALVSYYQDFGFYPPDCPPSGPPCPDKSELVSDGTDTWIPGLAPTYIDKLPKDPRQASLNIFRSFAYLFKKSATQTPTPQVAAATTPPTFDSVSCKDGTNVSSLSWTHTVGSGPNRILVLSISASGTNPRINSSSIGFDASYAGDEFDFDRSRWSVNEGVSPWTIAEVWHLASPKEGTNNVLLTLQSAGNFNIVACATSWFNVDQIDPFTNFNTTSRTDSEPKENVNNITEENYAIDVLAVRGNSGSITATTSAPQTQQWNKIKGSGGSYVLGAGSSKPGVAPSVQMSWNLSESLEYSMIATALRPVVVAVPSPSPSPSPSPTPLPSASPAPSPSPAPSASPISLPSASPALPSPPAPTGCNTANAVYCYLVTATRTSFVLWVKLERDSDQEAIGQPSSECSTAPPNPNLNFCLESP